MRTGADHNRSFAAVREVIHAWDPYRLIEVGAPEDEWDREIALVAAEIPRIRSEGDAVQVVSRVFSEAFQPERFGLSECADVGRRLYAALVAHGLLVTAKSQDSHAAD